MTATSPARPAPRGGPVSRLTRVTALDVDSGESETCEFGPDNYVVICGGDRYLAHTHQHANGTTVLTIKTYKEGGDFR